MGWASKLLRSLLGGAKKDVEKKEKRRRSFTGPLRESVSPKNSGGRHIPTSALHLSWPRLDVEEVLEVEEGSKHAIAVAVANATAANATVAAAVMRLKALLGEKKKIAVQCRAAVKIQTTFRCHLAKKALRALRGLVKLQALVRGFLVRRQAALTLRRLQALVRAQSVARSRLPPAELRFHRRSFERFDAGQSKCNSIPPKSRSFRRANSPEELLAPVSSPVLLCRVPSPRSVHGHRESSCCCCQFCPKTQHNTPRLVRPGTPAMQLHQVIMSPTSFPNYMARTTSSVAKVKSWRKAMEEDSNGAFMAGSKHGRSPMAASEAAMD
ncbi:protein IQ-DOMAIN 27-like [Zingiber officinale]|uniref:protein IQ-DOMAIN 27-like n=1 Tax=Zingiber officinale TaxID=94328 RepID=UPI001C4D02EB|nr:protein IQ-DOMAIN 27-like [Zingiber officinale]XP_042455455.1 protein IQ-DOMAIN 27-like [Zingiber officinale]XP_042455456.1 protein IQ-DOMAIN 27-like [Zingiber officinale]XP_042455457.1 protein IQ-DOMAIN 27-like [Zingiber officinale]